MVVAVVIDAVLVRPGVIVLAELSTQEECASTAAALPVMTLITSEVLDSIIILICIDYRVARAASATSAADSWVHAAATAATTATTSSAIASGFTCC